MTEHPPSYAPARIVRELEALIGREEVAEDYVRFRVMLLGAQAGVFDELTQSASPPDVFFEGRLLEQLLDGLCSALTAGDGNGEILDRLSRAAGKAPGFLARLARDAAFGPAEGGLESLAEGSGCHVEAILFFGRVLAAPFVTHAVGRLKQRKGATAGLPDSEGEISRKSTAGQAGSGTQIAGDLLLSGDARLPKSSGMCPWCGSPPGLARLVGGEGRRLLCCSLCGESWLHALLKCPTCQNEEGQDRLWLDPEDPCFVQACGNCRAYLKTVDERKLPESEAVIPLVWATATMHLDLIAQREGCQRAFPYTALT